MFFTRKSMEMVRPEDALPGRAEPLPTAETHFLTGIPLKSPVPEGMAEAMFGMGCFWGVERKFWQTPGVWLTMVGYAGGFTPNPTYKETCTQMTGHNEVVRVIYDPAVVSYDALLKLFWENHDPTQGMRQGNDRGASYRSAIYYVDEAQKDVALDTIADVDASGLWPGKVVTEVEPVGDFWEAEPEHQDYLERIPNGYTCHYVRPGWVLPKRVAAE